MAKTSYTEPLYFVNLNIDEERAYNGTRRGHLDRIAKGVYVNRSLSPSERHEVLRRNAARVAKSAFTGAILAGSSAHYSGLVDDHLLLESPHYNRLTHVDGAFSVYFTRADTDIAFGQEREMVTVHDDLGALTIPRWSDRLVLLKNFQPVVGRPKSSYLNNKDLAEVVERLTAKYGSKEVLIDELASLAKALNITKYFAECEEFVQRNESYKGATRNLKSYQVYWHSSPVATLTHDGQQWAFDYDVGVDINLTVSEKSGRKSPATFLASLLPESHKEAKSVDEKLHLIVAGTRYISNIAVVPKQIGSAPILVDDVLAGRLENFCSPLQEFNGVLSGQLSGVIESQDTMNKLMGNRQQPRMSGMQSKVAVHLDESGLVTVADDKAFTHILKFAPKTGPYTSMASMEWFSMTLAKVVGLRTEDFALIATPDRGPAFIAERFDVRSNRADKSMYLTEDFWSAAGLSVDSQKYVGDIMDVADIVLKHATNAGDEGRHLLGQVVFSWLNWNADLHLKNMMLLKKTSDASKGFESITLAPMYDVLCTHCYPNDPKTAALSLGGANSYTLAGFRSLGKRFGMSRAEVDDFVDSLTLKVARFVALLGDNLPPVIRQHDQSLEHIGMAVKLIQVRCHDLLLEITNSNQAASDSDFEAEEEAVTSFDANPADVNEHRQAELRRNASTGGVDSPAPTSDEPRGSAPDDPKTHSKFAFRRRG